MIVQVYEIQTPREAETMLGLGVDHVGSVLLSEERWDDPLVREVVRLVNAGGACSSLIPLFRDTGRILRMIDHHRPGIVHFCDTLSAEPPPVGNWQSLRDRQAEVRRRFPDLRVMRSIPVAADERRVRFPSLAAARFFEAQSDLFLTDTLLAGVADQPVPGFVGITGRTCHWPTAAALVRASRIPVILAGGIGPENVAAGIAAVDPAGVDSCTGTNARDAEGRAIRFRKDPLRVQRLVAVARQAR
jgi:phosphoribosylanthranilate isomerase